MWSLVSSITVRGRGKLKETQRRLRRGYDAEDLGVRAGKGLEKK